MSGPPEILAADDAGLTRAAELLRAGELVAIPTETVYGLAARADRAASVAAIYRAKGRPDFNPLIVHVGSLAMAQRLARFEQRAELLAGRFWPGPLTMVLPAREDSPVVPAVTAGLPTIALRMPAHDLALALLERTQLPLAAPSANRSFAVSPTRADHVRNSLGERVPAILDGGSCEAGLESTILALRPDGGWQVLRPGPIGKAALVECLGPETPSLGRKLEAPGQLAQHYSPGKPVRLDAKAGREGEFVIGFGKVQGDCNLSKSGDCAEAAANLYACLHLAASSASPRIAVAQIPGEGIGEAIRDRLTRAAVQ